MATRVLFVVVFAAVAIVACDKSGPSPAPAPSTMPDQSAPTSSAAGPAEALALQELRARAFNILTGSSCR